MNANIVRNAWIIVVEAPCLDVVLGQLGVGQQIHGVGHQLNHLQCKWLELEVDLTNLDKLITQAFHQIYLRYINKLNAVSNLFVKWIVV